jgi:hypothetical protein
MTDILKYLETRDLTLETKQVIRLAKADGREVTWRQLKRARHRMWGHEGCPMAPWLEFLMAGTTNLRLEAGALQQQAMERGLAITKSQVDYARAHKPGHAHSPVWNKGSSKRASNGGASRKERAKNQLMAPKMAGSSTFKTPVREWLSGQDLELPPQNLQGLAYNAGFRDVTAQDVQAVLSRERRKAKAQRRQRNFEMMVEVASKTIAAFGMSEEKAKEAWLAAEKATAVYREAIQWSTSPIYLMSKTSFCRGR